MTEEPERITARVDYDGEWDGQWCEIGREPIGIHAYHHAEYVRADIHEAIEADLAAEKARGDARVTAALREAAKIAKASDLGIGNAGDRVARVTAREILALVPDAGDALDRAIAEAVEAEREAVCRIIHDAITTGTIAPKVGVSLQDAIRARTEGEG